MAIIAFASILYFKTSRSSSGAASRVGVGRARQKFSADRSTHTRRPVFCRRCFPVARRYRNPDRVHRRVRRPSQRRRQSTARRASAAPDRPVLHRAAHRSHLRCAARLAVHPSRVELNKFRALWAGLSHNCEWSNCEEGPSHGMRSVPPSVRNLSVTVSRNLSESAAA